MHRSQELRNELRHAKAEVMKYVSKIEDLNAVIAKVSQELEAFPELSDQMAVEITKDAVIFLTAGNELTVTRDELQILVEMLGQETPTIPEVPYYPPEYTPRSPSALDDFPDFFDTREAVDLLVDEVTEKALENSPRGSWYYRVRTGSPLRTVFSDHKTWKFRQTLRRKAQNKNPRKLVIEIVVRGAEGGPSRILLTRTLWFGGSPDNPPTAK